MHFAFPYFVPHSALCSQWVTRGPHGSRPYFFRRHCPLPPLNPDGQGLQLDPLLGFPHVLHAFPAWRLAPTTTELTVPPRCAFKLPILGPPALFGPSL